MKLTMDPWCFLLIDLSLDFSLNLKIFSSYGQEYMQVNPSQHQSYLIPKVTFPNLVVFGIRDVNTSSGWIEEVELGSDDHPSSKLMTLEVLYDDNSFVQPLPSHWKLIYKI